MTQNLRRTLQLAILPLVVVMLATACQPPKGTVASVDVGRYAGTWYEIASIKQFFSVGLVNTKAEYTVLGDGSIKVVNSGNYLTNDGPLSRIEGRAVPVDRSNARLNVSFSGAPSTQGAGNYWIVDLDPSYQWAIVGDANGQTGFILTRQPKVSDALRAELMQRAKSKGLAVDRFTITRQF
jgi:lipocalin